MAAALKLVRSSENANGVLGSASQSCNAVWLLFVLRFGGSAACGTGLKKLRCSFLTGDCGVAGRCRGGLGLFKEARGRPLGSCAASCSENAPMLVTRGYAKENML